MELKIKTNATIYIFTRKPKLNKNKFTFRLSGKNFYKSFFPSQESGNQNFHVRFKIFVIIRNNKNMIYLNTNKGFK